MEWVASTFLTTSEHGVSSITTAVVHTPAASSWVNWRPCRFKWTRPFRRKTKSCFCGVPSLFIWPLHNMACLMSAGKRLGAHGFKKRMICARPWHLKDVARGTIEHRQNYTCPFVLNQWAVGNSDVCLILRWLQCTVFTRNCIIGCSSAAWRKFRAFRIFVVCRKPTVYRVTQKWLNINILFKQRVWTDFCAILYVLKS
jgi:hypothetical protein